VEGVLSTFAVSASVMNNHRATVTDEAALSMECFVCFGAIYDSLQETDY
jgi:hypothetical protein